MTDLLKIAEREFVKAYVDEKVVRATQSPETTTQSPETTTQSPETTTQSPETTTQSPETTTQSPETTTQSPETTTEAEQARFYEGSLDWKYTLDESDLDCLTNWDYYAKDQKTLIEENIARVTTKYKSKPWCATKSPTTTLDRTPPDTTVGENIKTGLKDNAGTLVGVSVQFGTQALAKISSKLAGKVAFRVMQKSLLQFAVKLSAVGRQALVVALKTTARAGGRLAARLGIKLASKIAQTGAAKLATATAAQLGSKLAVSAASEVGAKAALSGVWSSLSGPMMAFTAVSLIMDAADVGGYNNMQTKGFYFGMKKAADENFKKAMFEYLQKSLKEEEVEFTEKDFQWPMVYDPLSDQSEAEMQKLIAEVMEKDKDKINELVNQAIMEDKASGKIQEEDKAIDSYAELVADKLSDDLYEQLCGKLGGFLYEPGKCTLKEATCSQWPIKDDEMYREFRDGKCVLADPTVRKACESAKLPYDMAKGVCDIDEAYCKTKGAGWKMNKKIGENDCIIPMGQQALEAIFGTTLTRGLKQLFDSDQYEGCGFDGEFKVDGEKKCISVGSLNNGSKLTARSCEDGDKLRKWYYNTMDKTIRSMADYNKCWDSGNNKGLQVWECNGTEAQKFVFDSATRMISLKSAEDKCLRTGTNGVIEVTDKCSEKDALQKFYLKRHNITDTGLACEFKKRRPGDCPPLFTNTGAQCGRSLKLKSSDLGHGPYQAADCPSGYINLGLTCEARSFTRGGYPWKFGDRINSKGMYRRCERDHGEGNCEQSGLIVYPKCSKLARDKGYENYDKWRNDACCICNLPISQRTLAIKDHGKCPPKSDKTKKYTKRHGGLCYVDCETAYGQGYYNNGTKCALHAKILDLSHMSCKHGEKKIGAECERPCPTGYTNMGVSCHRRKYRKYAFSKK